MFLHGYGADGNDLIALGQHWRHLLPSVAFLSPHAPEFCGGNPLFGGRQWFELTTSDLDALWSGAGNANMTTPHMDMPTSGADNTALPPFSDSLWRGVSNAAAALNAFLDDQLAALGLDDSALALVGFSQGTMLALHVALRRPRAVAALVGFSGLLIEPGRLASEIVSRPPVLLVHGDADDVPFSERYQFIGDPRHSPYADTDGTGATAPHGYNWYFDNFVDVVITVGPYLHTAQ